MSRDINKIIGERLQKLRKAKGLTQEELGKLVSEKLKGNVKFGRQLINKYESGKIKVSVEALDLFTQIFEVNPSYFIKRKAHINLKEGSGDGEIIISVNAGNKGDYAELINELEKVNNPKLIKQILEITRNFMSLQETTSPKKDK